MRKFMGPIRRMYSEDLDYRNFVAKDYRRHAIAHHRATEEEIKAEADAKEHEHAVRYFLSHHKYLVVFLSIFAIALTFLFTRLVFSALAVALLLAAASFSTYYKRLIGIPLGGIELVTFGTVVVSVAFGPVVGLMFGLASSLGSEILSMNVGPLTVLYVITMGMVGFSAGHLSFLPLLLIGVIAVSLNLVINQLPYLFAGDEEIVNMTYFFIVVNIVSNVILFTTLGSRVVALIS